MPFANERADLFKALDRNREVPHGLNVENLLVLATKHEVVGIVIPGAAEIIIRIDEVVPSAFFEKSDEPFLRDRRSQRSALFRFWP